MEGFKTLIQAVDYAAERCSSWRGAQDGTLFSYKDMMGIALAADAGSPIEEPFWYAVFPDGEIAYLCTEEKTIDPIFLAADRFPVAKRDLIGFGPEEDIPENLIADRRPEASVPVRSFCPYCGNRLEGNGPFCPFCGSRL